MRLVQSYKGMEYRAISDVVNELITCLSSRDNELIEILCENEPMATAEDEVIRSIKYLKYFKEKQEQYISDKKLESACCYLPLNQPLYSLILNVLTASFVCKRVYYRPPQKLWTLHCKIYDLLNLGRFGIYVETISRSQFMDKYVHFANVIIYIGRYDNVLDISQYISAKSLLIYNGSALNPIIVMTGANLSLCAKETVNARLYNSGQDCMAPSAIFVHNMIYKFFLRELTIFLDSLKIDLNSWNETVVGPMIDDDSFDESVHYLRINKRNVVYGGHYDDNKRFIEPTIFAYDKYVGEKQTPYFAPFLRIYRYTSLEDIQLYLSTEDAMRYKGYVSIFGNASEIDSIKTSSKDLIVLKNETLLDYEDGNKEFGGYGEGCSFTLAEGKMNAHPILLLREIYEWRKND